MKSILIILLTALTLLPNLKAQEEEKDYATINVYLTKVLKTYKKYHYAFLVEFNNVDIMKIKYNEVLEYKIYSEGNVLVSYGGIYKTIDVKKGNTYFLGVDATKNLKIELQEKIMLNEFVEGEPEYFRLQEDIRNPVATMTKESVEKGPGSGSGFLLNTEGYIVTNHHVIDNAKEITVKGIGGDFYTSHQAEVVASDPNNDLAIIKLKNPNLKYEQPPYDLRLKLAETGEDVFVMGYPKKNTMGEEVKLTTGIISATSGYEDNVGQYQISAPVQPGNSGGPLFDKKGNIIGIVSAKHRDTENVGYAIKLLQLQSFILMSGKPIALPNGNSNKLENLALNEQIKLIKNFVYIIEVE